MAPRYTILIADDEPGIRQLVHLTIASDAYLILEAADGDEASQILQTFCPDVVLLDVGMPGRDGFALTRAIRADPLLAPTRVILLTGLKGPDAVAQGRAVGADHYLTKPFSPLHLLATLEACVGETKASGEWPAAAVRRSADSSASSAFTASRTARRLRGFREEVRRIDGYGSAYRERSVSITT
jgi:CheY-like chemotaxis protein